MKKTQRLISGQDDYPPLLDTVPDLAAAVNAMRADFGRPALPVGQVESYVGKGADVLVHRALTESLEGRAADSDFQRGKASFYEHYRRENGLKAVVFDGVRDALALMRSRGLALACVTNKPRESTHDQLARVGLDDFDVIVSGDDTVEKKPHPAPMLRACALLKLAPGETAMVGDSETDVLSARARGLPGDRRRDRIQRRPPGQRAGCRCYSCPGG